MMTALTTAERRAALLDLARALARRARRARYVRTLDRIRHIGRQLDNLDPTSPEAPAVLDASSIYLDRIIDLLEPIAA